LAIAYDNPSCHLDASRKRQRFQRVGNHILAIGLSDVAYFKLKRTFHG